MSERIASWMEVRTYGEDEYGYSMSKHSTYNPACHLWPSLNVGELGGGPFSTFRSSAVMGLLDMLSQQSAQLRASIGYLEEGVLGRLQKN